MEVLNSFNTRVSMSKLTFKTNIFHFSGGKLGDTKIPQGSHGWRTLMYNIDDPINLGIGAVRACGKAGNKNEVACTPWMRSTVNCNDVTECIGAQLVTFHFA